MDSHRVTHLQVIYSLLEKKRVPNVDHLIQAEGCILKLGPRGVADGPQSASDMINAVESVLEALKVVRRHCN
jgi:hypothetical protein